MRADIQLLNLDRRANAKLFQCEAHYGAPPSTSTDKAMLNQYSAPGADGVTSVSTLFDLGRKADIRKCETHLSPL